MKQRKHLWGIFFLIIGITVAFIGWKFINFPKSVSENEYSYMSRRLSGLAGVSCGIGFLVIAILLLKPRKEKEIELKTHGGINLYQAETSIKITIQGKPKYVIFLDLGMILIVIGLIIWVLVSFRILGRGPEDLFSYSNPVANIGTLILGLGSIIFGVGVGWSCIAHCREHKAK